MKIVILTHVAAFCCFIKVCEILQIELYCPSAVVVCRVSADYKSEPAQYILR